MTTYYVSKTGVNTNDGSATGDAYAWRTVEYACTQLAPGDTLKILPGLYREHNITLTSANCRNGTATNPITVTANDTNDKPKIRNDNGPSVRAAQILVHDLSYWIFDNLEISDCNGQGMWIKALNRNCAGMVVQNCDFLRVNVDNPISGHTLHFSAHGGYTARNCVIDSNYFYQCEPRWNYGNRNGNEVCTFQGDASGIIKDNIFVDCLAICINLLGSQAQGSTKLSGQPQRCIIRGNYITGTRITGTSGSGNSIYNDKAYGRVLIENNLVDESQNMTGIKINNEPWYDSGITSSHWIVRNNVVLTPQFALQFGAIPHPTAGVGVLVNSVRLAHNVAIRTKVNSDVNAPLQIAYADDIVAKNNIFLNRNTLNDRQIRNRSGVTYAGLTHTFDGNLYYAASGGDGHYQIGDNTYETWAAYTGAGYEANGQEGINVSFVDEANDDYTLDVGSEGLGDAVALTTTNGTGTASSVMIVTDALWFCDGFGLQGGDQIYVVASSPFTAVVVSVDYDNNTLYLESAATWQNANNVYYAYSSTADQGLTDSVRSGEGAPPVFPVRPVDPDDLSPPVYGGGDELLINEGFDDDTLSAGLPSVWCRYTAGTATFSIASSTLVANVTSTGGNTQLYQYGFAIESGVSYRVGLQVAGAAAKSIRLSCHEHGGSNANLGLSQIVSVTTSDEQFVYDWTATGDSSNARLRIEFLESTGGNMTFAYVSLQDMTDAVGDLAGTNNTTLTVAGSADDVALGDGAYNATATSARVGYDGGQNRWSTHRFVLDAPIPDGATVTAATLTIPGGTSSGTGWQIKIDAEDTDDAVAIASKADYDTRSWTAASVTWAPASWAITTYEVPEDLSAVIQEIVDDNSGLANGAAIQLRISDFAASDRVVRVRQYDESASLAAKLYLAWYSATGGSKPVGIGTGLGIGIGISGDG